MIRNKFAASVAATIGVCAVTVVLIILKLFGIPLEWLHVFLPLAITAGVWLVSCFGVMAIETILFLVGDDVE